MVSLLSLRLKKAVLFHPARDALGEHLGEMVGTLLLTGAHVSARAAMESWGLRHDIDLYSLPAHSIVHPIAELLCRDAWSSLLWRAEWAPAKFCNFDPAYPPDGWLQQCKSRRGSVMAPELADLRSARFKQLAADLRVWAPSIIASFDEEEDAAGARLALQDHVGWLAACSRISEPPPGNRASADPAAVWNSLLLRSYLRDNDQMAGAVSASVGIILGGKLTQAACAEFQAPSIPSSSSLQRADVSADVALMLVGRALESEQGPYCRYCMADSSPQCGRDWLLSLQYRIREAHLVETFRAARALAATAGGAAVRPDAESLENTLHRNISMHVHPPAALGSGKTSLEDKSAAFVFGMFLESDGQQDFKNRLSSIVSLTTDLGTEHGISSFCAMSSTDLLPPWLRRSLVGIGVQEDEEDGMEEDGHKAVQLLTGCLPAAGAMHMVHNLSKDVESKLGWWKEFHSHLTNLEGLLGNPQRRRRFISTCVDGTPHAATAKLFESFNGRLYSQRWEACAIFMFKALPLLKVLRTLWDARRYKALHKGAPLRINF